MVGLYWLKVDLDFRKGRYFALEKDLHTLAELNPYSNQVWDYAAWHQAFNVARRTASPEDAFRHRYEGLDLVRQGLSLLPTDRLLLLRLGLIGRLLAEHDRERFARREGGREPEELVFDAFDRLQQHADALSEERVLFAGSARDLGMRWLARGAWTDALVVFQRGRDALQKAAHAWEASGRAPPADLASIRSVADRWCQLARDAVAAWTERDRGRPEQAAKELARAQRVLAAIERDHPAAADDDYDRHNRADVRRAFDRLAAGIENEKK